MIFDVGGSDFLETYVGKVCRENHIKGEGNFWKAVNRLHDKVVGHESFMHGGCIGLTTFCCMEFTSYEQQLPGDRFLGD